MKGSEVYLTFTYYLWVILAALLGQFGLAAFLLGLNWDALTLAQRSDEENLQALETYSGLEGEGITPAVLGPGQIVRPNPAILVESTPGQASGMELGTLSPRHRPSHRVPSPGQEPLDLDAATMNLSTSAEHSQAYEPRESNDSDGRPEAYDFAQSLSENLSEIQDSALYITRRPTLAVFNSHSSQRPLLAMDDPA